MTAETERVEGRLTEDMIERARRTIGIWYPARPWNTVATKDNIRHWCYGIGDDASPLFLDPQYAAATKWGAIVAPPVFIASFSDGPVYPYDPRYDLPTEHRAEGSNFPGLAALHASDEWEFLRVVRLDDRVRAKKALVDLREVTSAFAGRAVVETWAYRYFDSDDEIIAARTSEVFRFERSSGRTRGKYGHLSKYRYSREELDDIESSYLRQTVRGSQPRFWQDVRLGDELGHVTHGPLTTTELAIFCVGWGGPLMLADEIAATYMEHHPEDVVPDPETNMPDVTMRLHWDDVFAREMGFGAALDIGMQRVAWFDHLLNNWKGDDGVTRNLSVRLVEPNLIADTTWIRGRVVRKHLDGRTPLIDIELTGTDQRGRIHSHGTATLALPSRGQPSAHQVSSLV